MKSTAIAGLDRGIWLGLAALLLLAGAVYWPGLSGGFLFDDFVNLDALGSHGRIDNWPRFWIYLTSGSADPTGRPLALLSFLLDARDWPAEAAPFLRTNLALHLLNGALLFALLRKLGHVLGCSGTSNDATALLASGLWLLHPLLVSTTLYVVQREAMLPATFTLLGLSLYVNGRLDYLATGGHKGAVRMVAGIVAGTALAMLAKANGILLPLLAWTLVATLFGPIANTALPADASRRLRWLDRMLLWLPAAAIVAMLARALPHLHDPLSNRPWTIAQRLLTEPRVLVDYLELLAIPRSVSTGLFNDDYPVSTGWLQPATTLPSLFIVLGLLVLAWRCRDRWPRLAAALLFFLAGHLLESTTVPLELYFEHRNYLPAMLLFWPLAHAIVTWRQGISLRFGVAAALLAIVATTTWQRSDLWGHPDRLAVLWATRNPESPRAQASAALQLIDAGQAEQAAQLLRLGMARTPGEVQLAFNYVNARCLGSGLTAEDRQLVAATISQASSGHLLINQWLSHALDVAKAGDCPGMDLDSVERWIRSAMANPALAAAGRNEEDFGPLLGELSVYRNQAELALGYFRSALAAHPGPDFAARLVTFLAAHGYYDQALRLLDEFERWPSEGHRGLNMASVHDRVLEHYRYWPNEFATLRARLQSEIARRPPAGSAP